MEKKKEVSLLTQIKRVALIGLGVTFGTVMFIITRLKGTAEKSGEAPSVAKAQPEKATKKAEEIPVKETSAASGELILKVKATPAKFARKKEGKIVATTSPGASCTLDAVYSTNRKPGSLETGPFIAGHDGQVEWAWTVSTGGDSVNVTVRAELDGHEPDEVTKKITIVD